MNNLEQSINNISRGKDLNFEESKTIFLNIMSGKMRENLIYNFLINLSAKGETAAEIAGGVYALLAMQLIPVEREEMAKIL